MFKPNDRIIVINNLINPGLNGQTGNIIGKSDNYPNAWDVILDGMEITTYYEEEIEYLTMDKDPKGVCG